MPRTSPFVVPVALVAPLALAVAALVAPLAARAGESASATSGWTLGGTAEVEKGGGGSIGGSLGYASAGGTHTDFSVGRSSLKSDNLETLTTTRVDAAVRHRFGDGAGPSVSLGVGWWQDPDTVSARQVSGGFEFGPDALRVGLRGGYRHSEFEPFAVGGTITLPGGRSLTLSGTASCTMNNVDYGLDFTHDSDDYTFYVQGTKYDYDDTSCRFSSRGLDALANSQRALFRQFAAAQVQRLSRGAASASDQQTTFLDYGVGAGFAWRHGDDEYGLDVDHVREQFDQTNANTATLHWARTFDSGLDLTVYAGATDSDAFGTLPFVGVGLSRSFR
jgi:hypothetical protein